MQKIVITGPESTGKTTLATELAAHLGEPWVPEYARTYLEERDGKYEESDLLHIARGQVRAEEEARQNASQYLICDTSLEVLMVWSKVKYGRVHPWITDKLHEGPADLYLLCKPDLPWASDPLREHPHSRDELMGRYLALFKELEIPFHIVEGAGWQRLERAMKILGDEGKL